MLSYAMKYSVVLATLMIGDVLWLSYFGHLYIKLPTALKYGIIAVD